MSILEVLQKISNQGTKKTAKEKMEILAGEIANIILDARLSRGLTQFQLARLMKTKQPSIARAEIGASLPSMLFLFKMAQALDVELVPPVFQKIEEAGAAQIDINSFLATPNARVRHSDVSSPVFLNNAKNAPINWEAFPSAGTSYMPQA